jgi:hypothetical protein
MLPPPKRKDTSAGRAAINNLTESLLETINFPNPPPPPESPPVIGREKRLSSSSDVSPRNSVLLLTPTHAHPLGLDNADEEEYEFIDALTLGCSPGGNEGGSDGVRFGVNPPTMMRSPSLDLHTPLLVPEEDDSCPILLNIPIMKQLLKNGLPLLHSFHKWKRIFSILRDGTSFYTFLSNTSQHKKTLGIIETMNGEKFGFYVCEKWVVGKEFYGNGDSFLFDINCDGTVENNDETVNIHKWTGVNRFFQHLTPNQLELGNGTNGEFGICIEDDFSRGTTGPCGTYGNATSLCRSPFEVLGFEVYGFIGEL